MSGAPSSKITDPSVAEALVALRWEQGFLRDNFAALTKQLKDMEEKYATMVEASNIIAVSKAESEAVAKLTIERDRLKEESITAALTLARVVENLGERERNARRGALKEALDIADAMPGVIARRIESGIRALLDDATAEHQSMANASKSTEQQQEGV